MDREAAEHEAFARSRTAIYIGRQEYFDLLDAYAAGDGPPLLVLGDSGCGKSALLANWALRYRRTHPDDLLLMHFIGASAHSADWAAMVRRITSELNRRFGLQQTIPDKPDELRLAFANSLHMAAARGRVILILDGLNQLEDQDQAPDLVWLPPTIPPQVRLLVSTLRGRSLDELEKRNWPCLQIDPLGHSDRRQLITDYLSQYRKTLAPDHLECIAASEQSANPLYLRAVLEELRVFGEPRHLEDRIRHYLSATTIPQLYERILERYEQDYERDRPGLVRSVMSLIWASRRGLSEVELLELLGEEGTPLPRAYWSPLYLASEPSLVNRSGLIAFSHDYMREAIKRRYLATQQAEQSMHLDLAGYFEKQEITARQVDEMPWQLARAQSWQRLHDLLADLQFFEACWAADPFEVKRYWALVECNSPFRAVQAYRPVLDDPQPHRRRIGNLATLLADMGRLSEAFALRGFLVEYYRQIGDEDRLQASLGNQALILKIWGRLDEAMALHRRTERLCRKLGNGDGLRISLGNQAVILYAWGRLEEAMVLHKQEEQLCRELGQRESLPISLGNQAVILKDLGRLKEAMALLKQVEQLCRKSGNKDGLETSLGNQALVLQAWGHLEEAMALLEQQEQLCRELGNKDGLQISLGEQANVHYARGRLHQAMILYRQKERFARELGKKHSLAISLGNQAGILGAWGRVEEAVDLLEQQERLCRELGNKDGLATSLANRATLLSEKMARPCEALPLAEEAYRIAADHGLAALAQQIRSVLESVRAAIGARTKPIHDKPISLPPGTRGDGPKPGQDSSDNSD